jgi:hypothetical protein
MVDRIIPHGTLAKGVLNNIYPLQTGPGASMVGRQPRHRHQKGPFVHRWSHPCLERNPWYYRTAIQAHLTVIPSFLPFCQQSSPCAGVNVRRVHSGQSSLVLKQSSRGRSLFSQYIGPFVSLDTHMRWNPRQGYILCDIPYKKIRKTPKIRPKGPFLTFCIGDWKGHCDQCLIAYMASPLLST